MRASEACLRSCILALLDSNFCKSISILCLLVSLGAPAAAAKSTPTPLHHVKELGFLALHNNHVSYTPIMSATQQSCQLCNNHISYTTIMSATQQSCQLCNNLVSHATITSATQQSYQLCNNHLPPINSTACNPTVVRLLPHPTHSQALPAAFSHSTHNHRCSHPATP